MTLYKFQDKDVFTNQLKTFPSAEFFIYDSRVIYNKNYKESGSFADPITFSTEGEKNLYELNVDRQQGEKIYPFVTKDGTRTNLGSTSTDSFNSDFTYGDKITGSYPFTSSLDRNYYTQGESRQRMTALKNTFNFHQVRSPHYEYSSSLGDKSQQESTLISIPKAFYGDKIEKGTLRLDFEISGTLMGRLEDVEGKGELIQVGPSGSNGSGSVAGVCLYEEGFIYLTGSWDLDPGGPTRDYIDDSTNPKKPRWRYFGGGINDSFSKGIIPSSSFRLGFKGQRDIANITMLAKARKGQLNYSQNPTFIQSSSREQAFSSSKAYREPENQKIRNIVSASYSDPTASFKKTTFINKVAIYDEDKKLLGVAKTSQPIKKQVDKSHMFKMKFDF